MNNILPTKNSFLLMLAFLLLGMPRPVVDATKDGVVGELHRLRLPPMTS